MNVVIVMMFIGSLTSCSDEEDHFSASKQEEVSLQHTSTRSVGSEWNGYDLLQSTGNGFSYFSSGIYAVKISRSWYNGTLEKLIRASLAPYEQGNAYCSATKYDKNG